MMTTRRGGFTLPELLVVMAVIGLLVAMLLPFLNGVFALQRRSACQANLSRIGQAFASHLTKRRFAGHEGAGVAVGDWQHQLLTTLSGQAEAMLCPEDMLGGEHSGLGERAKLDQYYLDIYPGGNFAGSVCLDEDESNEFVWKLSGTQFEELANTPGHGKGSNPYIHPGYVPDDNPNVYYWSFEDMAWAGSPDRDFWDLMFRVETTGLDIALTVVHGQTGYQHHLYLGPPSDPDRIRLIENCKQHVGETITVEGQAASSYGMNTVVNRLTPASDRILVLDYQLMTAACSPYDETGDHEEQLVEQWQPDPNDPSAPLPFARHMGKCNVLFCDGSARPMTTDAIHPDDLDNCRRYWNP